MISSMPAMRAVNSRARAVSSPAVVQTGVVAAPMPGIPARPRLVQPKRLVDGPHGPEPVVAIHEHRDLDVAGRDHQTLMFSAARAANNRSATPVWVRMPVPTIDTLLTSSS